LGIPVALATLAVGGFVVASNASASAIDDGTLTNTTTGESCSADLRASVDVDVPADGSNGDDLLSNAWVGQVTQGCLVTIHAVPENTIVTGTDPSFVHSLQIRNNSTGATANIQSVQVAGDIVDFFLDKPL
jgi:hypothetical protein